MSIENEIAGLTQSTTDLLEAVNTKKATLDNAVETAEAAKTVATSKAAEATTVVADASTHATNASNSASQAAASAASASQIVTGVATGLPSIRPSLNLDFVNSKRVDPRIDFTRSTTATYYDGKTTVKAEENVLPRSELFNDGPWTDAGLLRQADMAVAPNGTTTADHMLVKATDSAHRVYQNHTAYMGTDTYVTISVYAKANGYDFLGLNTGGNQGAVVFNLSTGVVDQVVGTVTSYGITDVGNGWYRCYLTDTSYSGTQPVFSVISQASATLDVFGSEVFLGDGISGIYLWGAQMENRDSLTAYTPTTTSPITNYVPVLQTAGINEPRLDHDPITGECKGLLIEGARTNHVANSEPLDNEEWRYNMHGVRIQPNVLVAPNGTLTASKLVYTDTPTHYGMTAFSFSSLGAVAAGTIITISGYYKYDGSIFTRLVIGGVFGNERVAFDFESGEFKSITGTNVLNTKAEDVGNGWWRLAVTYEFQDSIGNGSLYISAGSPRTAANQLDDTGYNGVYLWGLQVEQAPFATSYIPTNGSAVTRSGDDTSISAETLNYHPTEGTIVFDGESGYPHGVTSTAYAYVVDGKDDMILYRHQGGAKYRLGGTDLSMYFNDPDISAHHRHVVSYSGNNDLVYYADTKFVSSDTSLVLPTNVTRIKLGSTPSSTSQYGGWIKGFSYYPQRITNTEAEALAATI
jgi:hypothetical protein